MILTEKQLEELNKTYEELERLEKENNDGLETAKQIHQMVDYGLQAGKKEIARRIKNHHISLMKEQLKNLN